MRLPFFQGWAVVASASIGLIVCYSTYISIIFGLFAKPLAEEFGWSRPEVALAITICNWTVAALAPFLGWAIDRFGPRRLILVSIVGFTLALCGLALQPGSLWAFYALHVILPIAAAGTLPATYTRVIVAWFDRHRGLALGITLSGVGIGGIFLPPLLQLVITDYGWRAAYLAAAGFSMIVTLPVVAMFLREDPTQFGLTPDGVLQENTRSVAMSFGLTMREAIQSRAFWLLIVIFVALGVMTLGFTVNVVPLLTDRGFSPAAAAGMASILGVGLLLGRIVSGLLIDRFPAHIVALICLLMPVIGLAGLATATVNAPQLTSVCLFVVGFGVGAEFDFLSFFISRYIGLRVYGKVYGWAYAAFQIGCGLGPLLMAAIYDGQKSYDAGLWVLAGCSAVAALLFLAFGPYPVLHDRTDVLPDPAHPQKQV